MNKTKLAICMKDLEYQARFVNCFMNHYKHQYELHVFTNLEQLRMATTLEYAVIITGEYSTDEMTNFVEKGEILLYLAEDGRNDLVGEMVVTEKYQEVYKIVEQIERLVAEQIQSRGDIVLKKEYKSIGVYSLSQETFQVPFSALLGKIYGEEEKVLVLDLQSYSGLRIPEEEIPTMGLEDLLSVVTTGNYSRARILECIHHEPNWDYIHAAQNNQCLAEGTKELYDTLVALLVQELGYQRVIINFGTTFVGMLEMMEQSEQFYLLCGKEAPGNWREEDFFYELRRQEKDDFLHGIEKIELPPILNRQVSWNALVEKWGWGQLGEHLRYRMQKERQNGTTM